LTVDGQEAQDEQELARWCLLKASWCRQVRNIYLRVYDHPWELPALGSVSY
jgi:hypothetical protein